jgi:hypothetical protein
MDAWSRDSSPTARRRVAADLISRQIRALGDWAEVYADQLPTESKP